MTFSAGDSSWWLFPRALVDWWLWHPNTQPFVPGLALFLLSAGFVKNSLSWGSLHAVKTNHELCVPGVILHKMAKIKELRVFICEPNANWSC